MEPKKDTVVLLRWDDRYRGVRLQQLQNPSRKITKMTDLRSEWIPEVCVDIPMSLGPKSGMHMHRLILYEIYQKVTVMGMRVERRKQMPSGYGRPEFCASHHGEIWFAEWASRSNTNSACLRGSNYTLE